MKRLGILGGMGPAASAEFVNRLIQQTPANCDQEHIPFVLWNNPLIPDRSTSMKNRDNKPLPFLLEGIRGLKTAGCDIIVIPCNTAHFWFNDIVKINLGTIHIVDSVASALRDINVTNTTIGIIGTKATVELGLYQTRLNKFGWNCIVPSQREMDDIVQPAIDLIKSGKLEQAHSMIISVIDNLISRGARAVVLGCTEIPLSVREDSHNDIPLINSIDSLVKSAIKELDRP